MSKVADKFHEHLARCPKCANNPFNMCIAGQMLLTLAARNVAAEKPEDRP